jgi:hypothetical protein
MELVHGNQPVVERLHPEPVNGDAEGRMGADQHLVVAFEEGPDRTDLAAIIRAGRVAEVPFGRHGPVGPEAEPGQRLVMEACADRPRSGTTTIAWRSP